MISGFQWYLDQIGYGEFEKYGQLIIGILLQAI